MGDLFRPFIIFNFKNVLTPSNHKHTVSTDATTIFLGVEFRKNKHLRNIFKYIQEASK